MTVPVFHFPAYVINISKCYVVSLWLFWPPNIDFLNAKSRNNIINLAFYYAIIWWYNVPSPFFFFSVQYWLTAICAHSSNINIFISNNSFRKISNLNKPWNWKQASLQTPHSIIVIFSPLRSGLDFFPSLVLNTVYTCTDLCSFLCSTLSQRTVMKEISHRLCKPGCLRKVTRTGS